MSASLPEQGRTVSDLTTQVIAAELHLTFFAARHGKDSDAYRSSLRDFATAWYLLRKNRNTEEFLAEVVAP